MNARINHLAVWILIVVYFLIGWGWYAIFGEAWLNQHAKQATDIERTHNVGAYVLAFAGLAYSLFPYVVLDRLTLWQAAAHPSALKFLLAGAAIVLPFILGYTVYVYRLFGGKTRAGVYEH